MTAEELIEWMRKCPSHSEVIGFEQGGSLKPLAIEGVGLEKVGEDTRAVLWLKPRPGPANAG